MSTINKSYRRPRTLQMWKITDEISYIKLSTSSLASGELSFIKNRYYLNIPGITHSKLKPEQLPQAIKTLEHVAYYNCFHKIQEFFYSFPTEKFYNTEFLTIAREYFAARGLPH